MSFLVSYDEKIKNDFNEYYKNNKNKSIDLETLGEIAFILSDPKKMVVYHIIKMRKNWSKHVQRK